MSESPNNPSSTEKRSFLVVLWTDLLVDGADAYEYFCFDHQEALSLAVSEHKTAGRPLSTGTRFLVEGPCRDRGCDCGGKKRTKEGLVLCATTDCGWAN
jgi:hypothetical protein